MTRVVRPGRKPRPRVGDLEAVSSPTPAVPDPPPHLGESGLEAWERVWTTAGAWLSGSDVPMVEDFCRITDELVAVRADVVRHEADGTNYIEAGRRSYIHPRVRRLRDVEASWGQRAAMLGLSPTDRTRLGVAQAIAVDRLADFQARADQRRQ